MPSKTDQVNFDKLDKLDFQSNIKELIEILIEFFFANLKEVSCHIN